MTYNIKNYGFLRVAAVSPELRISDVEFNAKEIIRISKELALKKCSLAVFPELSITGYSCGDLFFNSQLIKTALDALVIIAKSTIQLNISLVVGLPIVSDGRLFNAAALINSGVIAGIVPKTYLCNSREYYEERWFSSDFDRISSEITIDNQQIPFGADLIFEDETNPLISIGIEICEDLWAIVPPSSMAASAGAQIIANLSVSNAYLGKRDYRRDNIRMHSGRTFTAYIYSAAGVWESSADTVFDGNSMICENAVVMGETERFSFETQYIMSDLDIEKIRNDRIVNNTFAASRPDKVFRKILISMDQQPVSKFLRKISQTPFVPWGKSQKDQVSGEITQLQSAGLARRLRHIGCSNVTIGISGGLDSTLALLATLRAFETAGLDKQGIHAISMPGLGTTTRTRKNANDLSALLGVNFREIDITNSVRQHFNDIDHDENKYDITFENSQARERTQILMDLANSLGGIVIGTGDMSEYALGWCTFNGDHMSMYGINAGIPKTLVRYLIDWYAANIYSGEVSLVLKDIADTPISPELLPASDDGKILQETEKSIGKYILHDFTMYYMIRCGFSPSKIQFLAEIAFKGVFDNATINEHINIFFKRFIQNQYKRASMPEGVKIGTVSLSQRTDWRMPGDINTEIWKI